MTQIRSKEIRMVPLDEIKLNPKNRNKHSKDQIARLAQIIEYQGFRQPLMISNQSGLLVAGHGRYQAAKKLKLKEVPVIFQDFDSMEQEIAAGVSDNSIALWAELDLDGINTDLADLGPDFNIDLLGILNFKIDAAENAGLTDPDAVPETPKESPVCRGEIFRLGTHRLLCGDSTSITDVERLMAGQKADMVFTDPPYGINNDTAKGATYNNKNKAYDDSKSFDLKLLQLWDLDYVIWGGNYYDWLPSPRTEIGWVVWDKRPTRETWDQDTRDAADRRFGQHFEIAVTNCKGIRGKMLRKTWGGFYGTAGNQEDAIVHRTQKPIELLSHFAQDHHKIILDYFCGSGSTLIACEKTSRVCYGMEIDPHYCSVILDRWAAFTGKDPVRLNDDGTETSWAEIKATLNSSILA